MKAFSLFILTALIPIGTAFAADESADREKVKKDLLMPECSWSKMSKEEYNECQKERDTMKVMTPDERARYLDHKEGRTYVTEGERGQTLRNMGTNRPSGGGRR